MMKPNFIIAVTGQSNSQGFGGRYEIGKTEDQPHERVMGWDANRKEWLIANMMDESLGTADHKYIGTQSFAFHFAKQVAKNDESKIVGVVNYGLGGQPIKRWTTVPANAMFRFVKNKYIDSDVVFSFKACNDRVLCLEDTGSFHVSRPVNVTFGWEAFSIIDAVTKEKQLMDGLKEKNVFIQNVFHNKYIKMDQNGAVTTSEMETDECVFAVEVVKTGYTKMFAFKGKYGHYMTLRTTTHVDGNMIGVDIDSVGLVGVNPADFGDIYAIHKRRIAESVKDAGQKKIDCVCWHQGEADYTVLGTYYENALSQVIEQYRSESFCNHDTVFIVGTTSKVVDNESDWWNVRNTQLSKLNADAMENTACVDTIGLETNILDKIHFTSEGHRQLGILYMEKYLELKGN